MNWTEKYRPKSLDDIIGNKKAVKALRDWAQTWVGGVPKIKGVVLSGDPGTGKTSAALALAKDFNWEVLELNASDARNESSIHKKATIGALNQTFTAGGEYQQASSGHRKLIIFDEADNLYERGFDSEAVGKDVSDRGGKRAIIETLEKTKHPIVLIVNDYYELTKRSGARIKSLTNQIKFQPLKSDLIAMALERVAAKEGITVQRDVFHLIANRCSGDMRGALNDLQSECEGRERVDVRDFSETGSRDTKHTIFEGLYKIFKAKSTKEARQVTWGMDESPDMLMLWIDENIPVEYKDPGDLYRAYDVLSKADIFYKRAHSKRHYSMLGYSMDLMSAGVAGVKRKDYQAFTKFKFRFPSYLRKMSSSKSHRALQKMIYRKLSKHCHTSFDVVRRDIIPLYAAMFNNYNFAKYQIRKLNLDKDMVLFILNSDTLPSPVKKAFKDIENERSGDDEDEKPMSEEERTKGLNFEVKNKPAPEPVEEQKQQASLFDF